MEAGWRLSKGELAKQFVTETDLWTAFNYVFSEACSKQSTYKFGLIKSILDNLLSAQHSTEGMKLTYKQIFGKFAENYWNLITKYKLSQMRKSSKGDLSRIEKIFLQATERSEVIGELEFSRLADFDQNLLVAEVTKECKRYVLGALYKDFEGQLYGFDLRSDFIWLNPCAYEFMLKYKFEIEQLNYYAWAKFLEKINSDDVLVRVLGKLELATPRRADLSYFRNILREEFECETCFYCGCKLAATPHVDHVIPWSFVKGDHLWNFVLACPQCNQSKNNRVPTREGVSALVDRNQKMLVAGGVTIEHTFCGYNHDLMWRIWNYAKLSGIKEYVPKSN